MVTFLTRLIKGGNRLLQQLIIHLQAIWYHWLVNRACLSMVPENEPFELKVDNLWNFIMQENVHKTVWMVLAFACAIWRRAYIFCERVCRIFYPGQTRSVSACQWLTSCLANSAVYRSSNLPVPCMCQLWAIIKHPDVHLAVKPGCMLLTSWVVWGVV